MAAAKKTSGKKAGAKKTAAKKVTAKPKKREPEAVPLGKGSKEAAQAPPVPSQPPAADSQPALTARVSAANTAPRQSPGDVDAARDAHVAPRWAQQGEVLTTAQGVPVEDTDNTLRVGARGPSLLEDFHHREKVMHFDHERIPERAVHARGAAAHGRFELLESLEELTCARFLCDTSVVTPTFTRFSTVAGSRGSADTARDVRGFATKFYTEEGNFDLVGNNIPVFFIQDGIKFPDLIHAVKPEPDREIPQAQSAHDTFWDFASLQPESTHMLLWIMSDRAIPRSYRMMEGFGIHTFRLVNAEGATTLVKWHWKPALGMHGLVWEEAQKLGGVDPDFHRRDLWNAIEAGAFPQWDLGLQVLPDTADETFEGIDLLDSTKLVPEELAPVRIVGRLTLDRNPRNYFAETEQVAFHPGHVVRGIDVTDDPLFHGRLFSYLDTQLSRLGGPNFAQLPINRPLSPVNDNTRDGHGQQAIHEGRAPYTPNSIGAGCPFSAGPDGYVHVPREVVGTKVRERPASFGDHFSQATLVFRSVSASERDHIVAAFTFELSKVADVGVVDRMLANLANVDADLVGQVAGNLGRPVPSGSPAADAGVSPALSMLPAAPGPLTGRVVALLSGDDTRPADVEALRAALDAEGAVLHVVGPHGGELASGVAVDKTFTNCQSVEFDAVAVADGAAASATPILTVFLQEAHRHCKTVGAWGDGAVVLDGAALPREGYGMVVTDTLDAAFTTDLIAAMGWHRHWERAR